MIEKKKEKENYKYIQEIRLLSKSNPPEIKELSISSTSKEIKENIPPSTPECSLLGYIHNSKQKKSKN